MHTAGLTALAACLVLFGCSREDHCPDVASACPDGCNEIGAIPWNSEESCWELEGQVVTCEPEGGTQESISPCVVRDDDGASFMFFGLPPVESDEWTRCVPDDTSNECAVCSGENHSTFCDAPEST